MEQYTSQERESLHMKAILTSLLDLGGVATRKAIKRDIYDNSTIIPEDYMDYVKTSKSGTEYKPFHFSFNYAFRHLLLAEYIRQPKKDEVELTEKGRKVDLDSFDADKVRVISEPIMKKKSDKKKSKKKDKVDTPIVTSQESVDEDVEVFIQEADEVWRNELKQALSVMHPDKFEIFARGLMNKMGVEIDKTRGVKKTGDGGIDGFGYITADDFRTARVALQAKRLNGKKVGSPDIDAFRGAMDKNNAEYGIFITTSDFSREAIEASREGTRVITLINGDDICDLVAKYEFYATPVTTYELHDFYFEDE